MQENLQNHYFNIADFIIGIYSKSKDISLSFSENYNSYRIEEKPQTDISIEVISGFDEDIVKAPTIFSAKHPGSENDESYFWSIHKTNKEYAVVTSDPGSINYPYLALKFDKSLKTWKLYVSHKYLEYSKKTDPFLYPMGPLILYYLSNFNNAIMIHASGVEYKKRAYVFTGKSGIGKSTIANLWKSNGARIINDDRLIIRQFGDDFYIYNTPMYYPDYPQKALLKNVFILHQSPTNAIKELHGSNAVAQILANCIQHDYNKELVSNLLSVATGLIRRIPVYDLSFRPDNSIFEFINNAE